MRVNRFLQAHGYEAGPTQRPRLSGAVSAALAEVPTVMLLWMTGALGALADAMHLDLVTGLGLHVGLVIVAGVVYGQFFQRAANDRQGGWLFGLAYGFLCWMAGPVTALEWALGRPVIAGPPAQGLFFAYLLWGLLVGLLFPRIHQPLQAGLDDVESRGPLSSRRGS